MRSATPSTTAPSTQPRVGDELGDVIAGRVAGRTRHDEITLFNSVGLGIEDLVTARLIVTVARRKNLGREIDLTA